MLNSSLCLKHGGGSVACTAKGEGRRRQNIMLSLPKRFSKVSSTDKEEEDDLEPSPATRRRRAVRRHAAAASTFP